MDGVDLETLLSAARKNKQKLVLPDSNQLSGLKPILHFLLSAPLEYLPRTVRVMLHRRLMTADVLVSHHPKDMAVDERVLTSTLLRAFLLQKEKEQTVGLPWKVTITMLKSIRCLRLASPL